MTTVGVHVTLEFQEVGPVGAFVIAPVAGTVGWTSTIMTKSAKLQTNDVVVLLDQNLTRPNCERSDLNDIAPNT